MSSETDTDGQGTDAGCPRVARARAEGPEALAVAMEFARACAAGAVIVNWKGRRLPLDAREDVVQEALTRVLQRITRTDTPVKDLQDWVRGTVDLILRERWKQESRHADLDPDLVQEPRSREATPDEVLLAEERHALVRECVDGLPAHYRQMLLLRYREQRPHTDIAVALNKTAKAVERALPRALKLVRDCLEKKRMAP